MRISDRSSDVCSSDLRAPARNAVDDDVEERADECPEGDRKSVVMGKSVSVRVDLGGGSIINKKKDTERKHNTYMRYIHTQLSPSKSHLIQQLFLYPSISKLVKHHSQVTKNK